MLRKFLISFSLVCSVFYNNFAEANNLDYETYIAADGSLYLKSEKITLLIHGDVATIIQVYPHNGLLKLNKNGNGEWQLTAISEGQLPLDIELAEYQIHTVNIDGNEEADLFVQAVNAFDDSFVIKDFSSNPKITALGGEAAVNSGATYADVNGDGLQDIAGSSVLLATTDGGFVNTDEHPEANQATLIGSTAGEFNVSESGAATYTIPLTLPEGIAGVKPQVSLQYSSQGGAGDLGIGWSLNAASAIVRCPQTIETDGRTGKISFSDEDRYCLNGQKLIPNGYKDNTELSDASYHAATAYHTEVDNFAVITKIGNATQHGPLGFKVETKSGEIHYYGDISNTGKVFTPYSGISDSSDAFVEPGGATVNGLLFDKNSLARVWAIKAIEDHFGNYIVYNYKENQADGAHRIGSIDYTGTHIDRPKNRVLFQYTTRGSYARQLGYLAGSIYSSIDRINNIQIYQDNEIFRYYKLVKSYANNAFAKDRTSAVQECLDIYAINCFDSINFYWHTPSVATSNHKDVFSSSFDTLRNKSYDRHYSQIMDFNGDGKMDMLFPYKPTNGTTKNWYIYFDINAQDTVDDGELVMSGGADSPQHVLTIDYNGDGTRDLLTRKNGNWYVIYNKLGTQTVDSCTWKPGSFGSYYQFCEPELLTSHGDYIELSIHGKTSSNAIGYGGKAQVVDFDGDGLEDILFQNGSKLELYKNGYGGAAGEFSYVSNLVNFAELSTDNFDSQEEYQANLGDEVISQSASMKSASMVDLNGDGRTDIALKLSRKVKACDRSETNTSGPQYEPCSLDEANRMQGSPSPYWPKVVTLKQYSWIVLLAADNSYEYAGAIEAWNTELTVKNLRFADFNGDGLSDVAYTRSGYWRYRLQTGTGVFALEQDTGLKTISESAIAFTQFVDFNRDGRADIFHGKSSKSWTYYHSRSHSNPSKVYWHVGITRDFDKAPSVRVVDLEGDGRIDLLTAEDSSGWKAYRNVDRYVSNGSEKQKAPDNVVSRISYSTYLNTKIYYDNTANSSVYTYRHSQVVEDDKGKGEVLSPMGGLFVVRRAESTTGSDESGNSIWSAISYQYGGAAVNKKGRGNLGFEQVVSIDEQTGIVTQTMYSQTFPFVGMPLSTVQNYFNTQFTYNNGVPVESTVSKLPHRAINVYDSRFTANGGWFPYISETKEYLGKVNTDNSYSAYAKVESNFAYDQYGNLTQSGVDSYQGFTSNKLLSVITNNEYTGAGGGAAKGRLSKTTVTKTKTQAGLESSTITRTSDFTYFSNGVKAGMLKSSTVQPGSLKALTTSYNYDSFGNTISTQVSTAGEADRTSSQQFSWNGRYLLRKTNPMGESETYLYNGLSGDQVAGKIYSITVTNPNKQWVTKHFDHQGLVIQESYSDGNARYIERGKNGFSGYDSPIYTTRVLQEGLPERYQALDAFGREIETQKQSLNGSWVELTKTYDSYGRSLTVSQPHFVGQEQYNTAFTYDKFGRPLKETRPNQTQVSRSYHGFTTTYTDPLGRERVETVNGLGELIKVEEYGDGNQILTTLDYSYDAYGNLLSVTTTDNKTGNAQTITNEYDVHGHKEKTIDPDKGSWTYTYNGFGELKTQQTANQLAKAASNKTEIKYDALGRMIWRYEPAFNSTPATTACWIYGSSSDVANKAVGKLMQQRQFERYVAASACTSATNPSWSETYLYNNVGRLSDTITTFNGKSFAQSIEYDQYGRVSKTTYPEGLQVQQTYSGEGIPYEWHKLNHGNELLRRIETLDASGRVRQELVGNSVRTTRSFDDNMGYIKDITVTSAATTQVHRLVYDDYDNNGNLKYRQHWLGNGNSATSFDESFEYDQFNRLESRTVGFSGGSLPTSFTATLSYDYDGFGNFIEKDGRCFKYHASKFNRIDKVYNSSSCSGSLVRSYSYDANGNVTADGQRSLAYTAFDKPISISKGSNYSEFRYTPARSRYLRKDHVREQNSAGNNYNTDTIYTTHYVGAYERIERSGGPGSLVEHKYHIAGAVISNIAGSNSWSSAFLHRDHQGSVISITDKDGQLKQQFYYDPWGKQHQVSVAGSLESVMARGARVANVSQGYTTRGYTGHEMLTGIGLIHMNGRVYDAEVGRFLQADPHVQAPNNAQNYNRYSYVLNNPMTYTDPSGYFFKKLFKSIGKFFKKYWRVIVAAVVTYFTYGAAAKWAAGWAYASMASSTAQMVTGVVAGAISGAVGGLVATGTLRGAAYGALSGGIFGGIGASFRASSGFYQQNGAAHISSHAVAGGVLSKLQGGQFGHGFLSAGVMKGVGIYNSPGSNGLGELTGRTLIQATVGGTLSKVTGGKFANGAMTSAIQYVVNQLSSIKWSKKNQKAVGKSFFHRIALAARAESKFIAGATKDELALTLGAEVQNLSSSDIELLKNSLQMELSIVETQANLAAFSGQSTSAAPNAWDIAGVSLGDIGRTFSNGFQALSKFGGTIIGGAGQILSVVGISSRMSASGGVYSFGYSRTGRGEYSVSDVYLY